MQASWSLAIGDAEPDWQPVNALALDALLSGAMGASYGDGPVRTLADARKLIEALGGTPLQRIEVMVAEGQWVPLEPGAAAGSPPPPDGRLPLRAWV